MNLLSLITVLDGDTKITITTINNRQDIFEGKASDYNLNEYQQHTIKSLWYSPIYKSLMIEI